MTEPYQGSMYYKYLYLALISLTTMPSSINVGQVFNIFSELIKELKPFIKTDDLKIAFDVKDRVYLVGDDFVEVVDANFTSVNDIKDVIRMLMAKQRSQYKTDER